MTLVCRLVLLVLLSFPAIAQTPVVKEDAENNNGEWYSRILNDTNSKLYCWVGHSEFYVDPRSYSRWYHYSDQWACSIL